MAAHAVGGRLGIARGDGTDDFVVFIPRLDGDLRIMRQAKKVQMDMQFREGFPHDAITCGRGNPVVQRRILAYELGITRAAIAEDGRRDRRSVALEFSDPLFVDIFGRLGCQIGLQLKAKFT